MGGSYFSVKQRVTLSSTPGTNYYLKLTTFYNERHIPISSFRRDLQIRVYMELIANVIALSGCTGKTSATINFANTVCKVLKLSSDISSNKIISISKKPEQTFYPNL